jgi:hypothetical protein
MLQECWAASDSGKAFDQALAARGFTLAQGDRRGHVAVDYRGEVYAIAWYVGVKAKEVQNRLGGAKGLPSAAEAKAQIEGRMTGILRGHIEDMEAGFKTQSAAFAFRKSEIVQRQREERAQLKERHAERWEKETMERSQRFRKDVRGLWDRVNGTDKKTRTQNERETLAAPLRDRGEKEELIVEQPDVRKLTHDQSNKCVRHTPTKLRS